MLLIMQTYASSHAAVTDESAIVQVFNPLAAPWGDEEQGGL